MNKKRSFANLTLHILGIIVCVVPPALATLCYFPLWKISGSSHTLAGGCALLLILSARPLFKYTRRLLSSPSSYVSWLLLFLLFFLTEKIAYEMTVISFIGLISNLLGAVLFRIAERTRKDGTGI